MLSVCRNVYFQLASLVCPDISWIVTIDPMLFFLLNGHPNQPSLWPNCDSVIKDIFKSLVLRNLASWESFGNSFLYQSHDRFSSHIHGIHSYSSLPCISDSLWQSGCCKCPALSWKLLHHHHCIRHPITANRRILVDFWINLLHFFISVWNVPVVLYYIYIIKAVWVVSSYRYWGFRFVTICGV